MRIQDSEFISALQVQNRYLPQNQSDAVKGQMIPSFQEILKQKEMEAEGVRFSKHASQRLSQRGIEMTDAQLERLDNGARMAKEKGIRDSLVMIDELAFIVNIPNNTVVTAMDSNETQTIFTNIDGAVFV